MLFGSNCCVPELLRRGANNHNDDNHSSDNGDATDDDSADDDHALLVGESATKRGTRPRALSLYDFFFGGVGFSGLAGAAGSVASSLCASSSAA